MDLNDNKYGELIPFNQSVLTAEGQQANIIGQKRVKIKISAIWHCITDILVAGNIMHKCIMGMDMLNRNPTTKTIMQLLKWNTKLCTQSLKEARTQEESPQINLHSHNDDSWRSQNVIQCNNMQSHQPTEIQREDVGPIEEDEEYSDDFFQLVTDESEAEYDTDEPSDETVYWTPILNNITPHTSTIADQLYSATNDFVDESTLQTSVKENASEIVIEEENENFKSEAKIVSYHSGQPSASVGAISLVNDNNEHLQVPAFLCKSNAVVERTLVKVVESQPEESAEAKEVKEARNRIKDTLETASVSSLRELTVTNAIVHQINIDKSAKPIKQRSRRIPFKYQEEFEKTLDDLIASGKVVESYSSWSSPLQLVKKKDGTVRITVDYRQLNQLVAKSAYLMTLIGEIFHKLGGAVYFTVIGLTAGYYQVPLDPASREYTAFVCSRGLFEFIVLPMGITGATETFQRMMNMVLEGLIAIICFVYLDDVIVFSTTIPQHIIDVQTVVDRLIKYNLKLKMSKCEILQKEIVYLSHVIRNGQITPNPAKVQDLFKFKSPLTARQIKGYVGLGSYYRRFIKNFAKIVSPLLRAVQGDKIEWTADCETAFITLRDQLTHQPVLHLPDFQRPFFIETDACDYGIGGVLSQRFDDGDHPIAYFSRHLNKTERNYSTTVKEFHGLVETCEHFRQFLYGLDEFPAYSDHQPLRHVHTW